MSNILSTIIADRLQKIESSKAIYTVHDLKQLPLFGKKNYSLRQSLKDTAKTGIIAEFKRASPSKGIINNVATLKEVTADYIKHGASCLSILTEPTFFNGNNEDVTSIAATCPIPVLRKDFIVDTYQVIETKAMGADVILLIAACLTPIQVKTLATLAKSIGLEVLLELHNEHELEHLCDAIDVVGINNRNLKTFEVDWQHSISLAQKLPKHLPKIAESGIDSAETLQMLRKEGFDGFLIGELFMKTASPGKAFAALVEKIANSPASTIVL